MSNNSISNYFPKNNTDDLVNNDLPLQNIQLFSSDNISVENETVVSQEEMMPTIQVVSFSSLWDMLILRFSLALHSASKNHIVFSTRRYGFLTGQLPNKSSVDIRKRNVVPTDEKNIEHRFFMCLKNGSYCVERALVVFQTNPNNLLKKVTLVDIFSNNILMNIFLELVITIYDENRWNAGLKYVQNYMYNDMPKLQQRLLTSAVIAVHQPPEVPSEESIQPVEQTLRVLTPSYLNKKPTMASSNDEQPKSIEEDAMDKEERIHFKLMQYKPLAPLHHFLRMCMDAANITEDEFLLNALSGNKRQYIWDVPADVSVDSLIFHIKNQIAQSIVQCVHAVFIIPTALRNMNKRTTAVFHGENDAFVWLLAERKRLVLLVNLVINHHYDTMNRSRMTNSKVCILNRVRTSYNDIITYMKLLLIA